MQLRTTTVNGGEAAGGGGGKGVGGGVVRVPTKGIKYSHDRENEIDRGKTGRGKIPKKEENLAYHTLPSHPQTNLYQPCI